MIEDDHTITYTPEEGYTGEDNFTYTVGDGNGETASAGVTVVVGDGAGDDDPALVLQDDEATVEMNDRVVISVLANDHDPEGGALTVESLTAPLSGTAALGDDGTVVYTPDEDFVGDDSFDYTVISDRGARATASVHVHVAGALFSRQHNVTGMRTLVYHEGRFYHVFADRSTGEWTVYLRTSEDGERWTPKVRVSDDIAGANQHSASLAVWGSGSATRVAVSWADERATNPQLRVAVSTDGGQRFGPSVAVSNHTDNSRVYGSIAVDAGGTLYAAWTRRYSGDRVDHVWFSRSGDQGATWTTPENIYNAGHYGEETHIAAGAAGSVWIIGSADRYYKREIYALRSADGGSSWETSVVVSRDLKEHPRHPSLLYAPDGTLHAIWQHGGSGSGAPHRVRTSRSTDGGKTWTQSVQVSDEVTLGGHRYNSRVRPSMAAGDDGTLYAVWADERQGVGANLDDHNYDVYLSTSTDDGATWSVDTRVNDRPDVAEQHSAALAVGPEGALVVWRDLRFDFYRLFDRLLP